MPDCKETKMAKMLLLQPTLEILSHPVMLNDEYSAATKVIKELPKCKRPCTPEEGALHFTQGTEKILLRL